MLLLFLIFIISACKYDPDMDHHDDHSDSDGGHMGQYVDTNGNGINDYYEESTHSGDGHAFVDDDADGICDRAQDGGSRNTILSVD